MLEEAASADESTATPASRMKLMAITSTTAGRTTENNRRLARRTGLTFALLLAIVAGLVAIILRPGRASLWPSRLEDWPSNARGSVGFDEPARR
jgi:hypothetical protein